MPISREEAIAEIELMLASVSTEGWPHPDYAKCVQFGFTEALRVLKRGDN